MIDKEKVRELAYLLIGRDTGSVDSKCKIITEWLEQNQPEPVVVGLSDEQVLDLVYYFSHNMHTPPIDTGHALESWLKTQTFVQPEVKEVAVGLSDEQVRDLASVVSSVDYDDFHTTRYDVLIQNYLKTQTFTQPETTVVGLSDEQVNAFACYYGLSTTEQSKLRCELKKWLNTQIFVHSEPPLSNEQVYGELYQEYQDVKKEIEQLKSQQFQPNWDESPTSATEFTVTGNWYNKNGTRLSGFHVSRIARPVVKPTLAVGQTWKNQHGEYEILGVNDKQVVRVDSAGGFMITSVETFLDNFERVK